MILAIVSASASAAVVPAFDIARPATRSISREQAAPALAHVALGWRF